MGRDRYYGPSKAEEAEINEFYEIAEKAEDLAEAWLREPGELAHHIDKGTDDEKAELVKYTSLMYSAKTDADILDAAKRYTSIVEHIIRRVARKEAERQHKADQDPTNSSQFED